MTHPDLDRIAVLLAMAAGIVARERMYAPALAEEFRAAAHAMQRLAAGVPVGRLVVADSAAPPAAQLVDALGGAAE